MLFAFGICFFLLALEGSFLDGISSVCAGVPIAEFRDICSCTYVQRFAQYHVCIFFIIGMCSDLHSMKFAFSAKDSFKDEVTNRFVGNVWMIK
jgi:hypothetical protein